MPAYSVRVIRDAIYGYVEVTSRLEFILDHPLTQRLRRVGQTSMTQTVYPAATGSRFEHSLGAMHLGRRAWRAAWSHAFGGDTVREEFEKAVEREFRLPGVGFAELMEDVVGAVGLLHDLGHPPFSHVLEESISDQAQREGWILRDRPRWVKVGAFHEFAGMALLDQIIADLEPEGGHRDDPFLQIVKAVYEADPAKRTWKGALHSIVAGEIDVDRLDYLMRDAQKAGTEFGAIDYERLVDALELHYRHGSFRIAPSVRARSAVETLLVQRAQSYRWITYHSRVVAVNLSLARAVQLSLDLARDSTTLDLPGEGEVTVGELFAPLIPNLNYLSPGRPALRAATRTAPGWAMTDEEETKKLRRFSRDLQAAVDDAAILQMLQRTTALALILEDSGVPSALSETLAGLRTYARAVLVRQRNFVSAWKTVDEFTRAVERFKLEPEEGKEGDGGEPRREHDGRLADAISSVYAEVIDELRREGDARNGQVRALEHERQVRLDRLSANPAEEINDIFRTLLSEPGPRQDRLRELLQGAETQFKEDEGFWQVAFASFKPVETDESFSVLYDGSAERSVLGTSPLVKALREVEQSRVRLFIYFFATTPDLARWRRENVESARGSLIGAFFQTFPVFLHAVWPEFIRASLPLPGEPARGGE